MRQKLTEDEKLDAKIPIGTLISPKENLELINGLTLTSQAVGAIIKYEPIMGVDWLFRPMQVANQFIIKWDISAGISYKLQMNHIIF
jgi:hypothetical protein